MEETMSPDRLMLRIFLLLLSCGIIRSAYTNDDVDESPPPLFSTDPNINNSQLGDEQLVKILQLETLLGSYNRSFLAAIRGVPQQFDWRETGKVSPVRDQGSCNACYAFTVTSVIESFLAIQYNFNYSHLPPALLDNRTTFARDNGQATTATNIHAIDTGWLSVQQLIDCSSGDEYVNNACTWGYIEESFKYIAQFGLVADSVYPFAGKKSKCPFQSIESNRTFVYNVERIFNASNWQIKRLIIEKGPLITLINDRGKAFSEYRSGLIQQSDVPSGNRTPNHAVLIIGWQVDKKGGEFWLVKNSWGTAWGVDGYGQVAFGVRGIGEVVYYPVLFGSSWYYFDTFRRVIIPILLTICLLSLIVFYLVAYFVKMKMIKKRFREFRKNPMFRIRFKKVSQSKDDSSRSSAKTSTTLIEETSTSTNSRLVTPGYTPANISLSI